MRYWNLIRHIIILVFLFQVNNLKAQRESSNLDADDYYRLAKIEANQKQNFAKGAYYCRKALELTPDYYDVRTLWGKCLLELKSYDSARYQLKLVNERFPRNVDAKHYLVNVEYITGRLSSAICYINELLEIKPYDKALWLKKIAMYREMGNIVEAKRAITRLYNIFPNDSSVSRAYRSYFDDEAEKYYKAGNYQKSKTLLEESLSEDPNNLQGIQKLVNIHINTGKRQEALNTIETGLLSFPTDPILIEKKIGILQEMGRYPEAITFCEQVMKKYPTARLRTVLNELKLESARYYNNTDPYTLYQKVYDSNPGNEEAYTFLLNNALSKGYYTDAEELIQKRLKSNPNDKNILMKQLTLFELEHRTRDAEKLVEKLATKFSGDQEIRDKYGVILMRDAKGFFQDGLYEQSKPLFEKLLGYTDYHQAALEYLYASDVAQKNYPDALVKINRMISEKPSNENYLFKKASLLEEMGQFDQATKITLALSKRNPQNHMFKESYISQSTPFIKNLIEKERYDSAMTAVDNLLANDPNNVQAYTYAININAQIKDYDKGLEYCDKAIMNFPDSKDFRLKEAGLYHSKGDIDASIMALEDLNRDYPYNELIQSNLAEEYFLKGRKLEKEYFIDSAIYFYSLSTNLDAKDTNALMKVTNLSLETENYDTAKAYLDLGLQRYPNNPMLLYKKGVMYELLKQYDSAYYYVKESDSYQPNTSEKFQGYQEYLLSKLYRNQAGIYFTRAYFDSVQNRYALASFEYQRYWQRNTGIYRLNYAARPLGTGVQHEFEWFHKLPTKAYTQFNIALANRYVFPKFKTSLSIFKELKYEWEAEVGARYVLQRNNQSALMGILGVAKSWEEMWVNGRVFLIAAQGKVYNTILLQSRYYFNYKNDYITIMGSLGTPPEDKTLDFQLNSFLTYTTRMVGAGIVHSIKHRSTIGIQGNWYNYQVKEDYSFNQYNVLITLVTKF